MVTVIGGLGWWFGYLGSSYGRDCHLVAPLESQTTNPNHQFTLGWHPFKFDNWNRKSKYPLLTHISSVISIHITSNFPNPSISLHIRREVRNNSWIRFFCHRSKSPSFTTLWEIFFKNSFKPKHFFVANLTSQEMQLPDFPPKKTVLQRNCSAGLEDWHDAGLYPKLGCFGFCTSTMAWHLEVQSREESLCCGVSVVTCFRWKIS